ncbi:MAG TPA: DUF2142 domain-containing protein [Solirubrobacter sp.]|nr:DUF2142 domain-containing protein [Solirubrobacter sp.]
MRRRVPAPLAILLAVATLQFLAWMLVLPATQAPDEQAHFSYAQRLMETGHLPPLDSNAPPESPELDLAWDAAGLRALVGNLSARPYWTALDEDLWHARDRALGPHSRDAQTGPNSASRNPPLYYVYTGLGYLAAWNGSFFDRLYAMRLANLPLYLLTIVMTWVLAGMLLGPARWPRTIATGVVAVQPQFAFVCAGISPDPFLTAIWSVFLVVAVRAVQRGLTWPTATGMVLLAAASVLTHARGAPLALLAVFAAGLALRRRIGRVPKPALLGGAVAAAAALALVTAFLVTRTGVLDSTSGAGFDARQFASYLWQFYLPRLPFMEQAIGPDYGFHTAFIETFYGVFASLEVRWSPGVYDALEVASLLGLIALAVVLVRGRRALRARWDVVALCAAVPVVLVAALHYAAYRNLQINPGDPIIVGRYLFPVLPLFGVAVAVVVRALPARLSIAAGTSLLLTGALLGLSGLGMTAVRFYV